MLLEEARARDRKIVEASSGSTVLSLGIIARVLWGNDDVDAYVTNKKSPESLNLLRFFGIRPCLYGGLAQQEPTDPTGIMCRLRRRAASSEDIVYPGQYNNENNWKAHEKWTGRHIFEQLPEINVFCSTVGTGGSITGTGAYLKSKKPSVKVVGVFNVFGDPTPGPRHFHGFHTCGFPWKGIVDTRLEVASADAYRMSMRLSREGLIAGPSSGEALQGLIQYIAQMKEAGQLSELADETTGEISCVFTCSDLPYQYLPGYFERLGKDEFPPIENEILLQCDQTKHDERWILEGHTRGLRILHDPEPLGGEPALVDIIFIHGLTGDAFRTWWHTSGTYWPTDMLPKDLPRSRILSFGYDADVTKLIGAVGQGTLRSHALTLLAEISALRSTEKNSVGRKVFIVAHSLGGLVAKKAICMSEQSSDQQQKELDGSIAGISFLGTPHQGSSKANYAFVIAGMMEYGTLKFKRVNKKVLEVLQPKSEVLADLEWSFGQWLRKNHHRISVACFFEEHEMPAGGIIVPETSAKIDGYLCLPIPNNHSAMPKFQHHQDPGYRLVISQLRMWYDKAGPPIASDNEKADPVAETHLLDDPEVAARHRACILSLSFPEMYSRSGIIRKPANSTCEWLLRHPSYQDWLENGRGILWILGHPGTGKSTLIKHAIRDSIKNAGGHPSADSTTVISFFFYNIGTALQRSPEGLLRSLLHQLLQKFPEQMNDLCNSFDRRRRTTIGEWRWQTEELMDTLVTSLTKIVQSSSIRLFVDALDECKAEGEGDGETYGIRDLIQSFRDIEESLHDAPRSFSACFTCRHYPSLAQGGSGSQIVAERGNGEDIKRYLRRELSQGIDAEDESVRSSLQESIGSLASGSFQWIKLVTSRAVTMYCDGYSLPAILQEVKSLPRDLSRLYESIFKSLLESRPALSLKLFQWIAFAQRPLTLGELRQAICIIPHRSFRSFQDLKSTPSWIEDDRQMRRLIPVLSGGLAEIKEALGTSDGPADEIGKSYESDQTNDTIDDDGSEVDGSHDERDQTGDESSASSTPV
ncbi:uncharacterized protein DNG_07335 [Cephalotrichum gorgonifer]|uniref:Uncharacterized protein n=1 Tax=Cephalotrichum gorgonifer TaxID=2041049 RepID=A0AAE8SXA9_9PEZI|nr:uncharacterized protein DNG_07335 [Cephalotrichum gorgonifer]